MWKDFLIFGLLISISVSGTKINGKEHSIDKQLLEEFHEGPEDAFGFNLLKKHIDHDETEYKKRSIYSRAIDYDEHDYDYERPQDRRQRYYYSDYYHEEENDEPSHNTEDRESNTHNHVNSNTNDNHPNKKEPTSHKSGGVNQTVVKEIAANETRQQIQLAADVVTDQASINKSPTGTNPAVTQAQPATNNVTDQSSTPLLSNANIVTPVAPNNADIVAPVAPNNQLPSAPIVVNPNDPQNQMVANPPTNLIAQPSPPVAADLNNAVPNTAGAVEQVVADGLQSRSSFPINDMRSFLGNQNSGALLDAYRQLPINNIAAMGQILPNGIKSRASLPFNIKPNDLYGILNLGGLQNINAQLPANFPPNNIVANRIFPQNSRSVALKNQNVNSPFRIFQQNAKNLGFQNRAIESVINNLSQDGVSSPAQNSSQNKSTNTQATSGKEEKKQVPNNQTLTNDNNSTLQLSPKNVINNGSADVSTQHVNSETSANNGIPLNHGSLSIKDAQLIDPAGNLNQLQGILMNNLPFAFENQLGAANQLPHIFGVRQFEPNEFVFKPNQNGPLQFRNANQQFLNNLPFTNHPVLPGQYNNMASHGLADLGSQLEKNFVENPKSVASVGQFIQENIPKKHPTDQPDNNVVKAVQLVQDGVQKTGIDVLLEEKFNSQEENVSTQSSSSSGNTNQNSTEEEEFTNIMGLKKKKTRKVPLGLNIYATIHKNSETPKEMKLLEAPIDLIADSSGFLFAVHGVNKTENYVSNFFSKVANVFTALNFTVVTVNWTLCITTELSPKDESRNIKEAALTGNFLGRYINKLNTTSLLYIIGDDLGTVAAAHAAYNVKKPLDFIFGTNERYFKEHKYNGLYLRQDMAKLVQVIHSNDTFFAYAARDFYPNKKLLKKKTTYDLLLEDAKSLGKTYNATLCYNRNAYKDKKCKENPVSSMFNTTVPKESVGRYFI